MRDTKYLLVGDVHATPNELDDCLKLVDCIKHAIQLHKPDYVVFLGDQAHTHAVLNLHVLNFWKETFQTIRPLVKEIICLVGNHDLPGNTGSTKVNSMSTLDNLCRVVDDFTVFEDILFVAYQADNKRFIKICEDHSEYNNVICHQTFQGATYENGFLATDGVEFSDLPSNQLYISGHIHTPHKFGRVEYIGAPRWRTTSDASVMDRSLIVYQYGAIIASVSTQSFVKQIVVMDVTPEQELIGLTKAGDIYYYNLIGPSDWVEKTYNRFKILGIVRKFPTDTKTVKVKESEGIDQALMKFVETTNTITPKETIKKLIEERLWTPK